jgi:hypothetical protein
MVNVTADMRKDGGIICSVICLTHGSVTFKALEFKTGIKNNPKIETHFSG